MAEPCPVTCPWHKFAADWVRNGDAAKAKRYLFVVDSRRLVAWRDCTCGMWDRVLDLLREHGYL